MKLHNSLLLAISLVVMTFTACNKEQYNYLERSKNRQEILETEDRLDKLYNMFLGLFSNKLQARQESSPLYRSQELIAVPIWPKRGGEKWLYICWLQEDRPNDLLSQNVWNFKKKDRETLEIVMYALPDRDRYSNDWRKKEPLSNLDPKDLLYYDGCTAEVKRESENKFSITGGVCKRDLSDLIKHLEIHGIATPDSIVFYNKMLDKDKKPLFSYEKGLHFDRQPKIFPKYLFDEE